MTAITVLSPHPDDAVLSVWHVLSGRDDVQVLNLFDGQPPAGCRLGWWDCVTHAADSRARARERVDEDARALRLAGRTPVGLGFLDHQYRRREFAIDALVTRVRSAVAPDRTVLAPAALGQHPDHALAREVALALMRDGARVSLYADLPHAVVQGWAGSRVLSDAELRRKLEAVRCYRSQVDALEAWFSIVSRPELLRYELVWPLAQASSRRTPPPGTRDMRATASSSRAEVFPASTHAKRNARPPSR